MVEEEESVPGQVVEESEEVSPGILRHLTKERIEQIIALSKKPDLYERLASAIAPSIYENEDVKKGILLQVSYSDQTFVIKTRI